MSVIEIDPENFECRTPNFEWRGPVKAAETVHHLLGV
jgi:hypothetical protein